MPIDIDSPEPIHAVSATGVLLDDLAIFSRSSECDETRALPDHEEVRHALADMFDALVSTVASTALQSELEPLLWDLTNTFHRACERLERRLDDNERGQRDGQRLQDGSEVRSTELERLLEDGRALLERRDTLELMREHAIHLFSVHTGSAWRARSGSVVSSRRALTYHHYPFRYGAGDRADLHSAACASPECS